MKLYLMRHGNAASPGSGQPSVLTSKGEKETAKVGLWLRKNIQPPALLWHSPLPRATQTAEIIQREMELPLGTLVEKEELLPEGNAAETYRALYKLHLDLLLVSHMPFLESLLGHFLDSQENPEAFDFPTAGICAIETEKGKAKFMWALHPVDL
jgi:phosphohistidine phosphatase